MSLAGVPPQPRMAERAGDLEEMIGKVRGGALKGTDLSRMVSEGLLSKSERRLITRKAGKPELTARQKLRQEIKAKKAQPRGKLSLEERKARFSKVDETEAQRAKEKANFTVCLGCRKRGHFLKDCPKAAVAVVEATAKEVCFNCGSEEHTLKDCPKPRDRRSGALPFALCFICKQRGHLARDCPQNANGLYPLGGCCHICLQKTHLAKDCPERTEELKAEWAKRRETERQAEEDKMLGPRVKGLVEEEGGGGDDLDDDGFGGNDGDGDDAGEGTGSKRKKKDKKERGRRPKKPKRE